MVCRGECSASCVDVCAFWGMVEWYGGVAVDRPDPVVDWDGSGRVDDLAELGEGGQSLEVCCVREFVAVLLFFELEGG